MEQTTCLYRSSCPHPCTTGSVRNSFTTRNLQAPLCLTIHSGSSEYPKIAQDLVVGLNEFPTVQCSTVQRFSCSKWCSYIRACRYQTINLYLSFQLSPFYFRQRRWHAENMTTMTKLLNVSLVGTYAVVVQTVTLSATWFAKVCVGNNSGNIKKRTSEDPM